MIFTEFRFFALFATCFCVYWALRSSLSRKWWLLLCSCVFYGAWSLKFLGLMFFSVTLDYALGLLIGRETSQARRKVWLWISMVANLGLLGYFKYFGWFVHSAVEFSNWIGLPASESTLKIVLPVGISFYTFQSMSYTIDVYKRHLQPEKSYLNFALYVTFFPQLVAGPIVRAIDFLHQLEGKRQWKHVAVRSCLTLFLLGYFKKAVLADHVSGVADLVFADPAAYTAASTWIALCLYHVQIYCDFSGYSDMAIATAGLLGYRLTLNFDFPFFSPSIGEFWRRWHISLGTWLKDYLYIPLGGSFGSWGKTIRNIWITMVLCGLWHGAGWQFVTFGALHAVYMTVNRAFKHAVPRGSAIARFMVYFGPLITTYFLFLGWPIFASRGFDKSIDMYEIMFFASPGGAKSIDARWLLLFAALIVCHWLAYKRVFSGAIQRLPRWSYAVGYGVGAALVVQWVATGYKPFIYFQF